MNKEAPSRLDLDKIRMTNPVLKSDRVRCELFNEKHLTQEYVSWFNDPTVCRYNRHGSGYSLEKARTYISSCASSPITIVFAIIATDKNAHIGNVSINDIDWDKKSAEISIIIGNTAYWGKGYGCEAFRLVIRFGFNELQLDRLWIGFAASNTGMRHIAEKLAFSHFNTLKAEFKKILFPPEDVVEWELRKPEKAKIV